MSLSSLPNHTEIDWFSIVSSKEIPKKVLTMVSPEIKEESS